MKVAMVTDDWWPITGGGPRHIYEISRRLAEDYDCKVEIITRALNEETQASENPYDFGEANVTVRRLGPKTSYWNLFGRAASVVSPLSSICFNNYDIVHAHTYLPAIPAKINRLIRNVPTLLTVHGTLFEDVTKYSITSLRDCLIDQLVLKWDYDHIISLNSRNQELLSRHHENVVTIPNGVDINRFQKTTNNRTNTVLFLGRLAEQKQVHNLILAFEILSSSMPSVELRIVGTGPEADRLKQLAQSTSAQITFTGRVTDEELQEEYRNCDLYALPSKWEGHPLTMMEAWANGRPVIAGSVTGIEEFVDHERDGYLVGDPSPDNLAAGIEYAYTNWTEARDWGYLGREKVEDLYSWEMCAERTHKLYTDVLDRGPQ